MSNHVMGKSCVHGYESAWVSRWTQRGSGFKLQAHHSGGDAKCSTKIKLPVDDQLLKESTGSRELKGKMISGCLDPFPNPDLAVVQSPEIIPDLNKEPTIVADRENSIGGEEGETSSSATKRMNLRDFINDDKTKLFKDPKRIRLELDPETNSRSQVKRLKTNASDYTGDETKSVLAVQEGPPGENVNYFFHRILNRGITKPRSRRNQEPFPSQIKNLKMGGEDEDFARLNPWIQRWRKKKAAETHQQEGGQEVSPKGTALEKQFPSVAAMALMGKTLRSFKPRWS